MDYSKLQPKLVELIDEKASNELPVLALNLAHSYTKNLLDYIDGVTDLSPQQLDGFTDYLVGCLTITLEHPIFDLKLLRARLCENDQAFSSLEELSYFPEPTAHLPKMGRLNKAGQPIFYASVAMKPNDDALMVILAEMQAKAGQRFNILRSHQKKDTDLSLNIIGIWDHIRMGVNKLNLGNRVWEYYQKIANYMGEKFDPHLLRAYQITDRFLADVMSRQGSERLYEVTSRIANVMLYDKRGVFTNVDGILYLSTTANQAPVIALTPKAVDDKIEHKVAMDIKVYQHYGYEFYHYSTEQIAEKLKPELEWQPC